MENMPCGAPYNTDNPLWPSRTGDFLDRKHYVGALKRVEFDGGVCTIEANYYKLSNEENINKAAEVTRALTESSG